MDMFENDLPNEAVTPTEKSAPVEETPVQEPNPPVQPPYGYGQPYYGQPQWYPPQGFMPYQMPPQPKPAPIKPKSEEESKPKSRSSLLFKLITAVLVCALIISNVVMGVTLAGLQADIRAVRKNNEENLQVLEDRVDGLKGSDGNSVSGTPNDGSDDFVGMTPGQIYAKNEASVVAINCSVASSYGQMVSSGTGFIWTADGYIISNYHVVDGAQSITITTNEGKKYTATFVGGDEFNDIALLKVDSTDLQPVKIGVSSDLIVGDRVVAIGNALGKLASTLTVGYVSAMDRMITTEGSQMNMIQTDAAINSGNSGGPLFNMKGEVIGVTTAKFSGTSNSGASIEGIGFAIPMDDVIGILEDLRDYGYVTGGYLGIEVTNMDASDAALYGLPMGTLVQSVTAGSCAAKAGIRVQDILVELGGYTIENINDLTRAMRNFDAGDTVTVVVYRTSEGGEVVLTVTLDNKPAPTDENSETAPSDATADEWFDYFFG